MTHVEDTTNLAQLLEECRRQSDPMLTMLEWLCSNLMEAEVAQQLGAEKSERSGARKGYRCGYRPRRLDTRMGTMYLMVPKVRQGGYIPFFVTAHRRSEAALVQVIQEAIVQGVSTRRIEKLAKKLGIESLSRGMASEMAQGLNEQVEAFRKRPLADSRYPMLWVDALYEKVRVDGKTVSMAIMVIIGVNEQSQREIIAVETMLDESEAAWTQLFQRLKERGLTTPKLWSFPTPTPAWSQPSAKASPGLPGSGARSIS